MRVFIGIFLFVAAVGAIVPTVSAADAPAPAAATTAAPATTQSAAMIPSLEHEPIRRSSTTATSQPGSNTANLVKNAPGLDVKRVCYSLAIVLCLILALRWGGKWLFPGAKAFRPSRAVQVISRNVIAPKQQVLVLQVGRRVVVVGDTGQHLNTLCEITDPDEVAALIGQIRDADREPMAKTFSSLFGRANASYTPPAPAADVDDLDDEAPRRESRVDVGLEDPALASTRQELSGLMDKVRSMAEQFQRR